MRTHAYRVVTALLAVGMSVAGLTACSNDSGASNGDVEDDTAVEELAIDQSSPAATVTTMLNAWQAGHPDIVMELIYPYELDDDVVVQTVEQAADALALPENGEVVNVEYTDDDGDEAEVDYTIELGGKTYEGECDLLQGGPDGLSWYIDDYDEAFAKGDSVSKKTYDVATVSGISAIGNEVLVIPGKYQVESSSLWSSYSGAQTLKPNQEVDFAPENKTVLDADEALSFAQEHLLPFFNETIAGEEDCKTWFERYVRLTGAVGVDTDALTASCQALTEGVTETVPSSDYRSVIDVTEDYSLESAEPTSMDGMVVTFATGRQRNVQIASDNTTSWGDEYDSAGCSYRLSVNFDDSSLDFSGNPVNDSPESCHSWDDTNITW